jgi:putative nucleotidyltransferase with HDIG domain
VTPIPRITQHDSPAWRISLAFEAATALSMTTSVAELRAELRRLWAQLYPDALVLLYVRDAQGPQVRCYGVEDALDAVPEALTAMPPDVAGVMSSGTLLCEGSTNAPALDGRAEPPRSVLLVPMRAGGATIGVLRLQSEIARRFSDDDCRILNGVVHHVAAAIVHLRERRRLEQSVLDTVSALSAMVEGKDDYTEGHCQRIAEMSVAVALRMGFVEPDLGDVTYAGLLHDIGKVAVPDAILRKPGPLTDEEMTIMRTHTTVGRRILEGLPPLRSVARIVEQHHERYGGGGYPHGLKGEQILLPARIISVVDAYDAMTTTRPYRRALSREEAIDQLTGGRGTQFDPEVVQVFLRYVLAIRRS